MSENMLKRSVFWWQPQPDENDAAKLKLTPSQLKERLRLELEHDRSIVSSCPAASFVFEGEENALILCRTEKDTPDMCSNDEQKTIGNQNSACKIKRFLLLFLYTPVKLTAIDEWKTKIYALNRYAELRIDFLRMGDFDKEYLDGRIARHCVGWKTPKPQIVSKFPEFTVGSLIDIDYSGHDKSDPAFLSVMFGKTGALLQRLHLVANEFKRIKEEKLALALGLGGNCSVDAVDDALHEMRLDVERLLKYEISSVKQEALLQGLYLRANLVKRIKEIKDGRTPSVDNVLHKIRNEIGGFLHEYEKPLASKNDEPSILTLKGNEVGFPTEFPKILLCGESGVGKTLFTKYIQNVIKKDVKVSRISIPEFLNKEDFFEYAMFGYAKGAYTGARDSGSLGLLMKSIGNVIFLDEIGEASLTIQAKLLAYMDDYLVRPRGWDGKPFYCPVLIIAATNRDLKAMAEEGLFRKDLLARFTDIEHIPPLRERLESVDFIIDILMQRDDINPRNDAPKSKTARWIEVIEPEALMKLRYQDYREGNFRELEEVLRRACRVAYRDGRTRLRVHDIQPQ